MPPVRFPWDIAPAPVPVAESSDEELPTKKPPRGRRAQVRHWLVNYAERHRAGLRVENAITEGTANFLANRRMNKLQQMRWSRRGADLLLQVRCAVYNGTLGSGFGQGFQPANDTHPQAAIAA
jgi:hypothetical protein